MHRTVFIVFFALVVVAHAFASPAQDTPTVYLPLVRNGAPSPTGVATATASATHTPTVTPTVTPTATFATAMATSTTEPSTTMSATPTSTPSPTHTPIAGILPINGDFEQGDTGWRRDDDAYIVNSATLARTGQWSALLGSSDGNADELAQILTVPVDQPYLHYWYTALSQHVDCYEDAAFVYIDPNPDDFEIGTMVESHFDFCEDREFIEYREVIIDLSAYAGQRVELLFRMSTDPNYSSYWSLDDIAFQSTAQLQAVTPSTHARAAIERQFQALSP
jgi:hypothetical protein